MAGVKWSDLSQRNQRLLIIGAVAETTLKAAALIDITRRPASQVRGPKWAWIPAVSVLNSAGLAPIAYFIWGRRR
ncbi:MAG TPA: PLDc N-terminal domain-containing protein [Streptosporangiaceae bacterium]|nr:PLDc N-terminal domain-containing protein [Streptosporangiaceae bacterium]